MTKKLTTILQYVFFLGLGIFFIWLSLKGLTKDDKHQISEALQKGNFWFAIPGIIILLLSHWVRALRWRLIMEPLDYKPSKINTFFAVMIGFLANQAVPRLGEVLRCSTLTKYEKIPLDKLLGTVILERLVDAISLLILLGIVLFCQPQIYYSIVNSFFVKETIETESHTLQYSVIALASFIVIIVLFLMFAKRKSSSVLSWIKKMLTHVWQGIISIKSLKRVWEFILLTILLWILYISCVYVGFMMLDESKVYGLKEAATVLCAGSLGMVVTPGGIGAYAYLVQKTMLVYGLSSGIGLALGWLLWFLQTAATVIAGVVSLLFLPIYNKNKIIN